MKINRKVKAVVSGAHWLLRSFVSCCADTSSLGTSCPEKGEDFDSTEQEGFIDLTDELAVAAAEDQDGL